MRRPLVAACALRLAAASSSSGLMNDDMLIGGDGMYRRVAGRGDWANSV